ncbi:DUF1853 family protein [Marinobacter bohaiensis]|uniref:DUF1853 family protein n=1 Tax=Marinobacter bohaiensis TaxID=2201898 RepID=UPI001D179B10|nr:DUF1853 family protein [Marinobacter bohaiensis]
MSGRSVGGARPRDHATTPILSKLATILKIYRSTPIPDRPHDTSRFWQTPAVRHLAWLCRAPTLTDNRLRFALENDLPADLDRRLAILDHSPGPLLAALDGGTNRRLGFYFERLYRFLLSDILEWPVLLSNHPVRENGRTLGELDFVVHNRREDTIEHHEIAVKFYLGYPRNNASTLWLGPNAHDRLDRKLSRLLDHQCRMSRHPMARAHLSELGIQHPPRPRLFMPGYLFYPSERLLEGPATTPSTHERGRWCRAESLDPAECSHWQRLNKPHWLGRFQSREAPDREDLLEALDGIRAGGPPRLFAEMAPRRDGQGWEERHRVFVVPPQWPGDGFDQPS